MLKPCFFHLCGKTALLLGFCLLLTGSLFAQTTAFTYQGRLTDGGSPANGSYDLEFKLFNLSSGGAQQGSTQTLSAVTVTNGIFTVQLDFGSSVFTSNAGKFLEIGVKNAGGPTFTTLPQRQPVNATPYAIQSISATAADSLSAACNGCVTAANIANGTITDADVSPTAAIAYGKLNLVNSILNADLVANAITTSKVTDGAITTNKIANDVVTSLKINDGTIMNVDVNGAAAIAYSKLNLSGSVQGSDIAAGTFTTTNAHHAIGNNDNTARELRLLEPSGSGVNFSAFKAQAQAGDLTYTLPNTAPTAANQVLQVQAVAGNNATLTWGTVGGGAILFNRTGVIANAGNTSYNVVSADDIIGVDMSAGTNFTINLQPATTAGEILIIKIERYNNALLPVLTIQPNGTDKIDGANNLAFGNAGGNRRLYSDGAGNWYGW